jgi:VWFA-related protein
MIILTLLGFASCGGGGGGSSSASSSTPSTPSISTEGSLDFGVVVPGNSSSRQLLISNTGSATLAIGQLSLANGSSFQITTDCSMTALQPGETCNLVLRFTPNGQSDYNDSLIIPSNISSENPATVALTGKGRALNVAINEVTTENDTVTILLTLLDSAGNPLNLIQNRFIIKEAGVQMPISSFTHPIVVPMPISVDLVFDHSGSLSNNALIDIKNAADSFVDNLTDVQDETAVLKFALTQGLRTGFLTDRNLVKAAIDAAYPGDTGGTILYDSLITAIDDTALQTNPRRAVIVFSDGNDEESTSTLRAVIRRAIQKNVPIYTIAYTDATHPKPEAMQQLAQETGGAFYLASSSIDLAAIYDDISLILSQQYKIQYVSSSTGGVTINISIEIDDGSGNLGETLKEATGCN